MLAYPCIFWWWCVLIWSIAAWGEPLRASGASNGFSAWSIGPFGIPPVLPTAGQGGAAPWTFGRACVLMSAPWRAASSPLLVLPWAPGLSGGFWDFGDGHSYSCFPMAAVTRRSPPHPKGRRVFYTFPFRRCIVVMGLPSVSPPGAVFGPRAANGPLVSLCVVAAYFPCRSSPCSPCHVLYLVGRCVSFPDRAIAQSRCGERPRSSP